VTDALSTTPDHLARINFAERVAADLRRAILRGELLPGEHVGQEQWAARFGVSRVPLREALKILTTQRLLSHDPHRGYFVTAMGDSEVEQIYRLRIFIEPEVMQSIGPVSATELAELEAILDRMENCILARRFADALDEERLFLFRLFDLSPLNFLATEAKRLWDISEPYRSELNLAARTADPSLGRLRKMRREMLEIVRSGDRDELAEMVRTQRTNALAFFTAG
jgi:DNA-binding GntR family transcriptional regulator